MVKLEKVPSAVAKKHKVNSKNEIILKNGAIAGYVKQKDGSARFQIIRAPKGASAKKNLAAMAKGRKRTQSRRKTGRKATPKHSDYLSPRGAKMARNRYYRQRNYKTDANGNSPSRKAAMTRNKNSRSRRGSVTDTRALHSPHRYDYPGLNDGKRSNKSRFGSDKRGRALAKATGRALGLARAKFCKRNPDVCSKRRSRSQARKHVARSPGRKNAPTPRSPIRKRSNRRN